MPADAGGRLRDVEADGVGDGLAGVEGLEEADLRAVGLDQVGPADQDPLPLAGGDARPAAVVGGPARGRDRDVDIGRAAPRDLLPAWRRPRIKARTRKNPTSKYGPNTGQHPATAQTYTFHAHIVFFEKGLAPRAQR